MVITLVNLIKRPYLCTIMGPRKLDKLLEDLIPGDMFRVILKPGFGVTVESFFNGAATSLDFKIVPRKEARIWYQGGVQLLGVLKECRPAEEDCFLKLEFFGHIAGQDERGAGTYFVEGNEIKHLDHFKNYERLM